MNQHPGDRPSPAEQPIRARVPDHVSSGAFSTGVIVMTAQTEFILDFVQNLGRPHQIVARVIMPHNVLPQLVDALQRNIDLYKGRWGELPSTASPQDSSSMGNPDQGPSLDVQYAGLQQPASDTGSTSGGGQSGDGKSAAGGAGQGATGAGNGSAGDDANQGGQGPSGEPNSDSGDSPTLGSGTRQATAQEVYDDLKIKDELLSGAYANAVMIGHGPHEFSFDFITNFYPNSAVSSRVFLAAGQVPRLYDSLKGTWEQLQSRMRRPPESPGDLPPGGEY
ncbi:MAG: hypothetical protein Aurels2KO_19630 [Aureliella sp.]